MKVRRESNIKFCDVFYYMQFPVWFFLGGGFTKGKNCDERVPGIKYLSYIANHLTEWRYNGEFEYKFLLFLV